MLLETTPLPETCLEDLIGCVGYQGPAKSLQEMESAIASKRFAAFDRVSARRATKANAEGLPLIELLAAKKR